jgi:hypothetical protein
MRFAKSAAAAVIAVINLGIHAAALATQPSAGGSGSVHSGTAVSGGFTVGSQGSSTSYATSSQSATASIGGAVNHTPGYCTVSAGIVGQTATQSSGKAYNISTGSGSGSAVSKGWADTAVRGSVGIAGASRGFNGGSAYTSTRDEIRAGTNQGSYVLGQTGAGFGVQLDYQRSGVKAGAPAGSVGGSSSRTVGVTTTTSGFAGGTNEYGALQGMNPAGVANIWANGGFSARGDLRGSTGPVRP